MIKVSPRYKQCIGTTHSESKESYGGMNDLLGITWQEKNQGLHVEMFHVLYLKKWRRSD